MADLFGVRLVTATIASMSQSSATRFQDFAAAVRDHVAAAPVKHLDETGYRIGAPMGPTADAAVVTGTAPIYRTRFHVKLAEPPDAAAGLVTISSSPASVGVNFRSVPL